MNAPDYHNLTHIGRYFGMSAVAVGRILSTLGYRDSSSKMPTQQALTNKWVVWTSTPTGQRYCLWKASEVVQKMRESGYETLDDRVIKKTLCVQQIQKLIENQQTGKSWYCLRAGQILETYAKQSHPKDLKDVLDALQEKTKPEIFQSFENRLIALFGHDKRFKNSSVVCSNICYTENE